MSLDHKNPEKLLDETLQQIGDERLEARQVENAAARVWSRITQQDLTLAPVAAPAQKIRTCEDMQTLIPAYLSGALPQPRTLLLEDHLQECVPCRRALRVARNGEKQTVRRAQVSRGVSGKLIASLAVAAVLLLGLGLRSEGLLDRFLPAPDGARATVESVDGTLFRVSTNGNIPILPGEVLEDGTEVRTARGSHAVLQLRDGSRIEISERAEVSIEETFSGKTIQLARGNIIVEAAAQRDGFLRVATDDCLVSVKGTVFSVSHGTKGSRVSVIEGEVAVGYRQETATIYPGQQITTRASLSRVPVEQEIAWSKNASQHIRLMQELSTLQNEMAAVLRPGLRNSSGLVDLVPGDSVIYLSIPNLTDSVGEAYDMFLDHLDQSQELQTWWGEHGDEVQPRIEETLARLTEFGSLLGDEVVVAVSMNENGEPEDPVFLAQVLDPATFNGLLAVEVDQINDEIGEEALIIVDDPATANPAQHESLYLYENVGIFAASPSLERLRDLASAIDMGASGFVGTAFHQRLAQSYSEGVGYLVGVDLETLLNQGLIRAQSDSEEQVAFERLGILDARHLIIERKPSGDQTETRAAVSFSGERRGLVSWLAEPGPMGVLDFVSADATAVAAFVVRDPEQLIDELFGFLEASDMNALEDVVRFQLEKGINIQQDVAAPIGGEFAFAIDGPLLPSPAWKIVMEVYDPSRLQRTMEWLVEEAAVELASEGRSGPEISMLQSGGRTYYSIFLQEEGPEVHYTFVDGYLVAAPSRVLLSNAIQFRETGYTLNNSAEFQTHLPQDGRAYYSAIAYQNLGSVLEPLADAMAARLGALAAEDQESIKQMAAQARSTLIYAYASSDSIIVATTGDGLPGMDLGGLMGLGGLSEFARGRESEQRNRQ